MLGNNKEDFEVKNRSFFEIDTYFSQGVSGAINEFLASCPDEQIQILDLAGGTESKAVKDIEIKYANHVRGINIDFAQDIDKGKGAQRVQGDATHIPLADSSVDIVYSRQLLPFLSRFEREHYSQVKEVFSEVARVLKPGGIAFLDDEEELSGVKSERKRQELSREYGVTLDIRDSTLQVDGNSHFPDIWVRNVRPQKFLFMTKL
jgi:ubiquinone/menaquinone biosynthesis C-methylase UbiE